MGSQSPDTNPHITRRLHTTASAQPPCGVQPGDVLERRFQIDQVLGWGGQAVVFQATDTRYRRASGAAGLVAIKVIRNDLSSEDYQDALQVLRTEARLLRQLHHPALPRLVRFASHTRQTWLARELIPGTPLSSWSARTPQGGATPCHPDLVRNWALHLCDLLLYLHTRRPMIVCCDVKPDNIVVRDDGSLALIDLGAAHVQTRRAPRSPRPRYGTPGYAPPEQLGNRGVDERTDLFSLGVVCYELLTGHDPTMAPLQFDLTLLEQQAPTLANPLRAALALDPDERVPTAAVLAALLNPPPPPAPLQPGFGVQMKSRDDLLRVAMRHPRLIEDVIQRETLDSWLATHPDPQLGQLLHQLRLARQLAPARQRAIDTFFVALAPTEGSAHLHPAPPKLDLERIPLRHWRIWGSPTPLVLHNTAPHPVRWELECPPPRGADIRVLHADKARRRVEGVLPPGGRETLYIVASGRRGKHQGDLLLRCGVHMTAIPWQGRAVPGVPIGDQFVLDIHSMNLTEPGLFRDLEYLLERNVLARWLRAQGQRRLADELEHASHAAAASPLGRRLLVARILHAVNPLRFPLLAVAPQTESLEVRAGEKLTARLEIENEGGQPCTISLVSFQPWISIRETGRVILPGQVLDYPLTLAPPPDQTAGRYEVVLELWSGDLVVPVTLLVRVGERHWWQRVTRWLFGRS